MTSRPASSRPASPQPDAARRSTAGAAARSAAKAAAPAAAATKAPPAAAQAALLRPLPGVPPAQRPWWRLNTVALGSATSLAVHAGLLLAGFVAPLAAPQRVVDDKLSVVLVNAKHRHAPKNPVALAQANLDGGGTVDQKVMKTSPLPAQDRDQQGDALSDAQRRVVELEAQTRELLRQAKGLTSIASESGEQRNKPRENKADTNGLDAEDLARAIARQEAVVDRQWQEYAARPRKGFITTSTKEASHVLYAERWRERVERMGDINYPHQAMRGQPLRSVMLAIEILPDGRLLTVTVHRSSGLRELDEAARRIVSLAAPFQPFTKDMKREMDILVLTRTFTFINAKVEAR